ncbi:MAG: hypothetical protein E6K69_09950 [Nitrospirae bacterium]|nr:MAG: hypothetical protein E6K69_09950 [Nitrospirota bacterium]
MKWISARVMAICLLVVGLAGCSYLFYPRAGDYLGQAKGATGTDTIINLTAMLEASAKDARGENYQNGLDDLHNQMHALHDAMCGVTKEQATTPIYAKAVTIHKELWVIFKRLWKTRKDQALRDAHLDLFTKRVQELREIIQTLKG